MLSNKDGDYQGIISARKRCDKCMPSGGPKKRLTNPAENGFCQYDTNQIGPWANWQGDLEAKITVIGQDWGDTRYYTENHGREKPRNKTNDHLIELFKVLDMDIGNPPYADDRGGVIGQPLYFMNTIQCLKEGGMSSEVKQEWVNNCEEIFRKTVELVYSPDLIALGINPARQVIKCFHKGGSKKDELLKKDLIELIEHPIEIGGRTLHVVYHPGNWGVYNRAIHQYRSDLGEKGRNESIADLRKEYKEARAGDGPNRPKDGRTLQEEDWGRIRERLKAKGTRAI